MLNFNDSEKLGLRHPSELLLGGNNDEGIIDNYFQFNRRISFHAPSRSQRFVSNINFKIREKFSKKYFSNFSFDRKYVYFPLSMIPEASTLIRGTKYYDQLSTIKSLSLEILLDWKLVIKEHPSMMGKNPLFFYKEINKIFNVVLLSPKYSSLKLISKSEAVISVTGTIGLEALALGKKTRVKSQFSHQC